MHIQVLKSKIHRARLTQTELHYVGSVTLDLSLMEASNLIENEKVQVLNLQTGARLETYVIQGPRDSGMVCLNGPAARLAQVGDTVIILSYCSMDFEAAKSFKPWVIFPDDNNKLVR